MNDSASYGIPALKVHQWLPEWEDIKFDEDSHRRRPSEHFYVTSIKASKLRALCDINRRTLTTGGTRKDETGVQRKHNQARSKEIAEFVKHGFPWSVVSESNKNSGKYDDLKKPGWLPTAIVVNVLRSDDVRTAGTVAPDDLVRVEDGGELSRIVIPHSVDDAWRPSQVAPIEVIDGQHRLWAFDENDDYDYELPVVLFDGLDISWQAYLFYVINIKPAKINTSLGFDLYPLLRTEDWLEHAGGPTIYRESRAQELTEALWSFEGSPWYQRIDMLGDGGRNVVRQAAWIRSLLSTFVKKWESNRTGIGGLFGAPAGKDEAVLPWNRSQQSAFLIEIWSSFRDAVRTTDASWAVAMREHSDTQIVDVAFEGDTSLPNTDQGVRAILGVYNDLFYLRADELNLSGWRSEDFVETMSQDAIGGCLESLRENQPIREFMHQISISLAEYDWRTYGDETLNREQKRDKGRFRGSTGYRELKLDVLSHLAENATREVSECAEAALGSLGWK